MASTVMYDVLKAFDHKDSDPILFKDVTGVILAGGKSRRYGKNKALVKIDGIPLIEKPIDVLRSVFQHLVLITNTPNEYAYLNLPIYKDLIKGLGPLGGVYTALSTISNDTGFFVACDMPSLNIDLIRYMVKSRDDYDVVLPRISGKLEPLHALYSKRCLPAIKRLIDSGEYQILRFFSEVLVRYIEEDEIQRFDPGLRSFFNINRPLEIKHYK